MEDNDNYRMVYRPGVRALQAGVRAAHRAYEYLGETATTQELNSKKRKMAPVSKQTYKNANPYSTIRKNKSRTYKNKIKSTLLKMAVPYHLTISDSTNGVLLKHNTIYSYNITAQCVQGTSNINRQGDGVYLEYLKVRGYVRSDAVADTYVYRILVGWSGEEFNPASLLSTALTATEIFLPNTGNFSQASSLINPKAFQVLYDETIDINSNIAGVDDIHSVTTAIPLKTKFTYQAAASVYGTSRNLYFVVLSSNPGGTVGVTATGDAGFALDLCFKNL